MSTVKKNIYIFNLLGSGEQRHTKAMIGIRGAQELCESRGGLPYSILCGHCGRPATPKLNKDGGEMIRADTYTIA